MKEYTRTQHLIDALEYILEFATTEGSTCDVKLGKITTYCKDLAEITELYKKEDPEYEVRRRAWQEQVQAQETVSAKLRPRLVDNGC